MFQNYKKRFSIERYDRYNLDVVTGFEEAV